MKYTYLAYDSSANCLIGVEDTTEDLQREVADYIKENGTHIDDVLIYELTHKTVHMSINITFEEHAV